MSNGQPGGAPAGAPDQGKVMAILAYIGPLVIVSYLMAKDNPTAKFHIRQGAVLFVIEVVLWILSSMFFYLWMVWQLVNLGLLILSIIGIVNVVQGKEKELPLVGGFAKHVPL